MIKYTLSKNSIHMRKACHKVPSVCNFTIHTLSLGHSNSNAFQIKWKRGESKGMTERVIPDDDNLVYFEKRFRCPCSIYCEKGGNLPRPKHILFSVHVIKDETKRLFGKVLVDVSRFFNVAHPELCELELDSPDERKSSLTISFSTTPVDRSQFMGSCSTTDDSLTSTTDATPRVSGRQEASSGDTETLFEKLKGHDESPKLAHFRRAPVARMRRCKAQTVQRESQVRSCNGFSLATFLRQSENQGKVRSQLSIGEAQSVFASSVPMFTKSNIANDSEMTPKVAINLLKSVLGKNWCCSPVTCDKCPKAVAAIVAALLHLKLFNTEVFADEMYKGIVGEFVASLKDAKVVTDGTAKDLFLVMLLLMRCVLSLKETDENRLSIMKDGIEIALQSAFDAYVWASASQLAPFAGSMIRMDESGEELAARMVKEIERIVAGENLPHALEICFKRELVRKLDALLVNVLCSSPCSFGRAGQWNALITILEGDNGVSLTLFRQAVGVLMMSQTLCDHPEISKALCSALPVDVIFHLLETEQPDELMSVANDVRKFASHYRLTPGKYSSINVPAMVDTDKVLSTLPCDWDRCNFDSDEKNRFKYLQSYF